ncbi:phage tail protein [Sphingobium sp. Leaf26]|uniref:phage tail protein n=1 Tax=Sphingobium sp. Leaf26 TaxID=1735693 RepID=UPI0009EA2047|nr:tail fiber protein [Sphingobium sp. Leaf26]
MDRSLKSKIVAASIALAGLVSATAPQQAAAQASEPFLGQLALLPYNFCPRGWADASGQILSIAQNTALFSLLGTTYGGNGQTTFALPDLRGRAPIGQGSGPGLAQHDLGEVAGEESTTITILNMPAHTHTIRATNEPGNKGGPGAKLLASDATVNKYSDTANAPNVSMNPQMVTPSGGSQPISIRDPYLALRWCIALQGIFPSRD